MKKLVDNKDKVIQLHKERLQRKAQPFPLQEKLKTSPGISESVVFQILNYDADNADYKINTSQSEASTSKESNLNIFDINKLTSEGSGIFSNNFKTSDESEQHEYLTVENADEIRNIGYNAFRIDSMKGNDYQYLVERIKLSDERESDSEIGSSLNFSLSESLFSDLNFLNSREERDNRHERKLLNSDELVQGTEDSVQRIKKKTQQNLPSLKQRRSKNSWLHNKAQLINFFSKERRKKKKSKIKDSDENEKGNKKSKIIPSKYLDPQVTPEQDLETKQQLLDFFIYIIYLIVITTVALSMVSSNMFYLTNITTSVFFDTMSTLPFNNITNNTFSTEQNNVLSNLKTLRESKTLEDFWAFAESTMLDLLYWNFYYPRMNSKSHNEDDDRKMLYENQILGVARMRQVRVRSDSCKIHPDVQRFFDACYFYYSVFTEETEPIKQGMETTSTATAWVYTEAKQLDTSYYWGEVSIYGGGGYYLDLGLNKEDSVKMIQELKENFWISKATRAVFINFNLYNANANLFCICRIVLEFPPVGGIIPVADFHSLKIIRYLSIFDFFILGCEFLYVLFVIYYTWQILRTLIRQKLSFFLFFWNYLDLIIFILSFICIILSIVRYANARKLISTLSDRYNEYTEFNLVKDLQINYNNSIAVLLFFCWIKLFKYFNFNKILLEFRVTLARSLKDILGFFPMFLTMFLAFAFLAYLLFGNQVKTYDTLWLSFLTLLQAFLGEFYYTDIVESNRVLGPIFYIAYIFFIFFVLLNVFIAIINDAYTSVKSQLIYDQPRTGKYMKRGLLNILTCGRSRFSRKLQIKGTKKKVLFQEIEMALKKAGFSTTEIKIFFYKYNINFCNFLDECTKKRIVKDLELKRIDFSETSEQVQINALRRKLENLTNRMEDLEIHLQPVLDKVDSLIRQLK